MQRGQERRPRENEQHIKTDDPLDRLEYDTEEDTVSISKGEAGGGKEGSKGV